MLAAIDGTSSAEWLNADGSNSHVFAFYRDYVCSWRQKEYFAGPNLLGENVTDIVDAVMRFLRIHLRKGERLVDLVGHSRGGHIAILVAQRLHESGMAGVRFLGLYDAVDRSPTLSLTWRIPPNVQFCAHARRSRWTLNRLWFGNTGTFGQKDRYVEEFFYATHGAVGGDPFSGGYLGMSNRVLDVHYGHKADLWMRGEARKRGVLFAGDQVRGSHVQRAMGRRR